MPEGGTSDTYTLRPPTIQDGGAMWRVARDSRTLDLNSSYTYLLWARDFASTSVVAEAPPASSSSSPGGGIAGFITAYRRPEASDTLMVWQVAVDAAARGQGLAGRMLDYLVGRVEGVSVLEATISDDNAASKALFGSFARKRGAEQTESMLFARDDFPDTHEGEVLHRIGPF